MFTNSVLSWPKDEHFGGLCLDGTGSVHLHIFYRDEGKKFDNSIIKQNSVNHLHIGRLNAEDFTIR